MALTKQTSFKTHLRGSRSRRVPVRWLATTSGDDRPLFEAERLFVICSYGGQNAGKPAKNLESRFRGNGRKSLLKLPLRAA